MRKAAVKKEISNFAQLHHQLLFDEWAKEESRPTPSKVSAKWRLGISFIYKEVISSSLARKLSRPANNSVVRHDVTFMIVLSKQWY